jgi:D-alanine-D-alanine ligase-like ATP-grasp enzyme
MLMRIARRLSRAIRRLASEVVVRPPRPSEPTLKSLLIEETATARGYASRRLSSRVLLVEMMGRTVAFEQMNGPLSSTPGMEICNSKHLAREVLRDAGLEVVESCLVSLYELSTALKHAEEFGYPVVVKPTNATRGQGVTTNIMTPKALREAIIFAGGKDRHVLLEKHFFGEDFRFFVVDDEVISVTHRVRANVTGDGRSTIRQLIEAKNTIRRQNRYLCDCPIPLDPVQLTRMVREGHTLESVPVAGEVVTLRDQSNLSAGGDSVDVTDDCHPGFREIAVRALVAIPGMRYAGLDLLTADVTRSPAPGSYIVGEVEYSPAPLAHYPAVGQSRDMAGAILDFYERELGLER